VDTPAADIEVDEPVVRRLLREQHPDLAELELRLVANGWDNVLYRLGSELVVRLPRRTVAAELIEHEQRWLPSIAARVSVAVPAPVRIGRSSDGFPWHWSISPWLEGELASRTSFADHGSLAADLATFVAELHTPAPAEAPANPVRGVPLASRDKAVRERLSSGLVPRAEDVAQLWDAAVATEPWTSPPVWLHGDLHPANILVRNGRLAAVIDFGDLTGGDPATDLATAWLTFDPDGRARFRAALDRGKSNYGDATWARARGWAITMGTALVTSSADNPAMHAMGVHALEQVLLDAERSRSGLHAGGQATRRRAGHERRL
jgi:aminoglycoside phosphotransferase (APT) family kinase protein